MRIVQKGRAPTRWITGLVRRQFIVLSLRRGLRGSAPILCCSAAALVLVAASLPSSPPFARRRLPPPAPQVRLVQSPRSAVTGAILAAMNVERMFLDESARTLRQLAGRIEACLARLNDDQIWARGRENENAVGNLVLHLTGNVRQWIIAHLGAQPDSRQRDQEFAARGGRTGQDLSHQLKTTVDEAVSVIESLDTQGLTRNYTIQKYEVTGLTAVYHVVEHFAQHTGQIIFATKMLTGADLGFYSHLKTRAQAESASQA